MFYLYQSNRLENLSAKLLNLLQQTAPDPFMAEQIVVNNPGMARWLRQQIGAEFSICANYTFPLPAVFINQLMTDVRGDLPDTSLFSREVLIWRIMALLSSDKCLNGELAAYIKGCSDERGIFQFSCQVADLFDQYQVYRPDMLAEWEARQKPECWQSSLWRLLSEKNNLHRSGLLSELINKLKEGNIPADRLPTRLFVFGLNALPPHSLAVFAHLAQHTDVHLFHLSPCREYWGDIDAEKILLLKEKKWHEKGLKHFSSYFTSGNPLLSSFGMVGQEFANLMADYGAIDIDLYEEPAATTLLSQIQTDILNLQNRAEEPTKLTDDDDSMEFNRCHSPMREVQVLYDRLLAMFEADESLLPSDILVMAPDISLYAPLIEGYFTSVPESRRIPFRVNDLSVMLESGVAKSFYLFFELISGRVTAAELIAWLETPAVMRGLGFTEEDLQEIRLAVHKSGICWGLNDKQQKAAGDKGDGLYSWRFGFERLLMGWLSGENEESFCEIYPRSYLGSDQDSWLAKLGDLLDFLEDKQFFFTNPHLAEEWGEVLMEVIDFVFSASQDEKDVNELIFLRSLINNWLAACANANFNDLLAVSVLQEFFKNSLNRSSPEHGFLDGRVVFANLVPMRSLPFKVIYLLGMDDSSFPRVQTAPTFDLMRQKPRMGDRNRRDDDCYLFLEALLSARQRFVVSWVGRSQKDNQEMPESVLVAELRNYIRAGWQTSDRQPADDKLTFDYPLQPFSPASFRGARKSYEEMMLPSLTMNSKPPFCPEPLPFAEDINEVQLADLLSFWSHPVKHFVTQRLCIRFADKHTLLPEHEPFALDNLDGYKIEEEIARQILQKKELSSKKELYLQNGLLPMEPFATISHNELLDSSKNLLAPLADKINGPMEDIDFALEIDGITIKGKLDSLYKQGRLCWRPANLKGKDVIKLWLCHLILLEIAPAGISLISRHAAKDKTVVLSEVDNPRHELQLFLDYFLQGLTKPLPFYPESSWALFAGKKEEADSDKAKTKWETTKWHRGESEDIYYKLVLEDNPLNEEFIKISTDLLQRLSMVIKYE